jgi:hypothetical protein
MLTDTAQRALRALQTAGKDWIERDQLIEKADIRLPDEELDTQIVAVWNVVNELRRAGYTIDKVREAGGDFFRLTSQPVKSSIEDSAHESE